MTNNMIANIACYSERSRKGGYLPISSDTVVEGFISIVFYLTIFTRIYTLLSIITRYTLIQIIAGEVLKF